jgi:hypothetical protein
VKGFYAAWTGQTVVLQLATEGMRVSLRGVIVGESAGIIRFRHGDDLVIDIFKDMILALKEDDWTAEADAIQRGMPFKARFLDGRIVALDSDRRSGWALNTF